MKQDKSLPGLRGKFLMRAMARANARFRISIKDNQTKRGIKVELIEARGLFGERRYQLRLNGKEPANVKEATLTEVFERLRRWLVKRAD